MRRWEARSGDGGDGDVRAGLDGEEVLGQWCAAITVYVTDAAGTGRLELDMIVTADAVSESPSA